MMGESSATEHSTVTAAAASGRLALLIQASNRFSGSIDCWLIQSKPVHAATGRWNSPPSCLQIGSLAKLGFRAEAAASPKRILLLTPLRHTLQNRWRRRRPRSRSSSSWAPRSRAWRSRRGRRSSMATTTSTCRWLGCPACFAHHITLSSSMPCLSPPHVHPPHRYVLHCVHACDGPTVAASLSNREIKLYERAALGLVVRPSIEMLRSLLAPSHVCLGFIRS